MRLRAFALAGLAVLGATAPWSQPSGDPGAVRYRVGDDPRWAAPDVDDRDWGRPPDGAAPDTSALLWARVDIDLSPADLHAMETPAVAVAALAAHEVFWDGVRIGGSGRVGRSRAEEQAGPMDRTYRIPDSLATPGAHLLAMRLSTFRRPPSVKGYVLQVRVGDLREMTAAPFRAIGIPLVFLGGFVLIALYYGTLYVADRRRTPYLLTALLCLAVAALLVAESWRPLVGYDYDLHVYRLWAVAGLTWSVGVLLSAVFVVQFEVPRGRLVLGLLAVGIGATLRVPGGYDTQALAVFAVSLPVALGLTLWAVVRRRPGARWAAAGVAVCLIVLLATGLRFLDMAFFPSFSVLMAGLLASLGLQTRDARRRHEAALAAAARLEAELLKTHLQPHFLMNTLTSVMEWIETEPATGVRFLDALADELRVLAEISGERLVPMARELALCRSHLEVMRFRREIRFELDTDGVDPDAPIPPAVIHTLLENAITHNAYAPGTVRFRLREARHDGRRRYTLTTPLAGDPPGTAAEGGGLGYVRARLAESHPGDWALASAIEEGAWVTRIDLPTGER